MVNLHARTPRLSLPLVPILFLCAMLDPGAAPAASTAPAPALSATPTPGTTPAALPATAAGSAAGTVATPACVAGNLRYAAQNGLEYQRDKIALHDLVIEQCGSALRAQARLAEATVLDFADSNWGLSGGVELRVAEGKLDADEAKLHFLAGKLASASATGSPATFESDSGLRGTAHTVEYDLAAGEVRLIGDAGADAWITKDGCNETRGGRFVYNLAKGTVLAQGLPGGTGQGRVQGTIRPQCNPARATPRAETTGSAP